MNHLNTYYSQTFYILWNIVILASNLHPFLQRDLFPSRFPNKIVYIFSSTHACYIRSIYHINAAVLCFDCC
jgi:hypothetical protein